jgi:hypothetical protein
MSTRQLRLSSIDQIKRKMQDLKGKKINIVMRNQTAVLGTVQTVTDDFLDVVNMRLTKVKIQLQDVSEIYYDTKE